MIHLTAADGRVLRQLWELTDSGKKSIPLSMFIESYTYREGETPSDLFLRIDRLHTFRALRLPSDRTVAVTDVGKAMLLEYGPPFKLVGDLTLRQLDLLVAIAPRATTPEDDDAIVHCDEVRQPELAAQAKDRLRMATVASDLGRQLSREHLVELGALLVAGIVVARFDEAGLYFVVPHATYKLLTQYGQDLRPRRLHVNTTPAPKSVYYDTPVYQAFASGTPPALQIFGTPELDLYLEPIHKEALAEVLAISLSGIEPPTFSRLATFLNHYPFAEVRRAIGELVLAGWLSVDRTVEGGTALWTTQRARKKAEELLAHREAERKKAVEAAKSEPEWKSQFVLDLAHDAAARHAARAYADFIRKVEPIVAHMLDERVKKYESRA